MAHVLIVEDHEENRNLLKLLLEVNGYRVSAAGDGLEALAAARADVPDIIVSDALMPNMDGFALCRAWMQDRALKDIPFVFYSATYVKSEHEEFALALGAVRYLVKPLEAKVFLKELRAVLQQWSGRAAPAPVMPLDVTASHAMHESVLARKLEDKIAQLEQTNRRLQESETRFRSLTEMSSDFYWESNAEHRLSLRTAANHKSDPESVFGHGAALGARRWDLPSLSPDEAGWAAHRALLDAHQPFRDFVLSRLGADGSERFISISGDPVFDAAGTFTGYRGVGSDITARVRAERARNASEDKFTKAFMLNPDAININRLEDGLYVSVNRGFTRIIGYGEAELLGRTSLELDIWADPADRARLVEGLRNEGVVTNLEARFRTKDGRILDGLMSASIIDIDGVPHVISITRDVSERKQVERQMQEYVGQLENAFMSTVKVATTLGEMRDPYTAGHQRKVAEIAVAIGAEMGLDARGQEGLRVAGYLHDIGKINIPAEMLSKPGKLSAVEYQLIKGHAQSGYDVLKDVEFPWPVAEVALQHHERVDGSGYPQGLKGEAIVLEARIMAVADVVEAMSSHRPYRAGLGIDNALAEIERGSGGVYDSKVADACLRLFREKGYSIPI